MTDNRRSNTVNIWDPNMYMAFSDLYWTMAWWWPKVEACSRTQ